MFDESFLNKALIDYSHQVAAATIPATDAESARRQRDFQVELAIELKAAVVDHMLQVAAPLAVARAKQKAGIDPGIHVPPRS